jgi:hypothetical protein
MNRKLRTIALTLSLVLAGALSASSASAADFHSESTADTVLKGSQVGSDKFVVNAGSEVCNEVSYEGIQTGATATTVKVIPKFSECTAFGFIHSTYDINGCFYEFSGDDSTMKIVCPEGQTIVKTAFNCWVTIGSQTLSGATSSNTGAGTSRDIDITLNVTGIHYVQHSKSFPGCSSGTRTDGKYIGSITLQGFSTVGEQVGIWRE